MTITTSFRALNPGLTNLRTYIWAVVFVAGNLILPQLCHFIPEGGKMFLPIYFFTLIAAYKFGIRVGLLTAVFSPLVNCLFFGMPPLAVLPVLLIKSSLLAIAASWVAGKWQQLSLLHLVFVVAIYQFVGGIAEWILCGSWSVALQDWTLGLPGIVFQIVGGWLVLKFLARYEC